MFNEKTGSKRSIRELEDCHNIIYRSMFIPDLIESYIDDNLKE
jgi:hypothetical protein